MKALKNQIAPLLIAILAAGTAPWWWDIVSGKNGKRIEACVKGGINTALSEIREVPIELLGVKGEKGKLIECRTTTTVGERYGDLPGELEELLT